MQWPVSTSPSCLAIRALCDDPGVDAVLAVVTPVMAATADDLAAAMLRATKGSAKPVLASLLAVAAPPAPLRDGHIPWYPSPEAAVHALARAAAYAAWRQRDPGVVPELDHIDPRGDRPIPVNRR